MNTGLRISHRSRRKALFGLFHLVHLVHLLYLFCLSTLLIAGPVRGAESPDWTLSFGPAMSTARMGHEIRLLADGRTLVLGGHGAGFTALDTAELFDPVTATFTLSSMRYPHDAAAVALLVDGRYLVAGGAADLGVAPGYDGAETFDPQSSAFTGTGDLQLARMNATAATLADGRVLVVGGWYDDASTRYAERYDPQTGAFTLTGALNSPRSSPVVLPTDGGGALVLGGISPYGLSMIEAVEEFDPADNVFRQRRATLFEDESGWLLRASNFRPPPRLADGRYLLLAYRPGDEGNEYSLFTVDPATGSVLRQTTTPALEASSVAAWYPPLVDATTGVAYLLGQALDGDNALLRLRVVDLADWSVSAAETSYILPGGYYLGHTAAVQLMDGRLLITGGHSERGANTNFTALASTLVASVALPEPASCVYSLSAQRQTVAVEGGGGSVALTASNPDCAWGLASSVDWVTVSGAQGGQGSATVGYTVAANHGAAPRMGVLTIGAERLVLLQGAAGQDTTLTGTSGDDLLTVAVGSARIDGLAGSDTLQLPSFPDVYTLIADGDNAYTARYLGHTVQITNVEFLRFGREHPTTLPVDALMSGEIQDQVRKLTDLYLAFFGRAPDVGGLEYWLQQLLQAGRSLADISRDFAWSAEAQALYPQTGSNRDFVGNVYQNVFDRNPDPGGWDYWTDRLDALGDTDLNDRGAFVGELLLGAYAPTSGAADRDLLGNRHDVALSYVNRLSLQPEKGFDPGINELLAGVNLDEDSAVGAELVLDYVFGSERALTQIIADPAMLDTVSAVDVRIDWQAEARWLPATVTLPEHTPLLPAEVTVSLLFDEYAADVNGDLDIPVPDTDFTDAFVMLPLPGSDEYVVYLMATILAEQQSVEFSAEATAVDLLLGAVDRQLLQGGLSPAQVRETIRLHGASFIEEFATALGSDPYYLRPDNLDTVYGGAFPAALAACKTALQERLSDGELLAFSSQGSGVTELEGLTVLPQTEQYDFKVFPGRSGWPAYGAMNGKLLIQNDSMLPIRYMLLDRMTGVAMHSPPFGVFGDLIGPQAGLLYGYNASSGTTVDTSFQAAELLLFTPGVNPHQYIDDEWLRGFSAQMQSDLMYRVLLDNVVVILSSLVPVADDAFVKAWFQWIGDQGWFQASLDHMRADPPDLQAAINSFATGMANWDNLAATLAFSDRYLGKAAAGSAFGKLYRFGKNKAQWLFKSFTWKAKFMVYGADVLSTQADLVTTPRLVEFDKVQFPLYLDNFGPSALSKVAMVDETRRVTLFGGRLNAFSAAGGTHEPRVHLEAVDVDGEKQHFIVSGEDIHPGIPGSVWFDLPFEWVDSGGDIVGPIYFQLEHAFVDPYTNSVIDNVRFPVAIGDETYRIELTSELVITSTSLSKVTRGDELWVFGAGFALGSGNNTVRLSDHTGQVVAASVDTAGADRLSITVPNELAIGALEIEIELKDGSKSNRYPISLVPQNVSADPADGTDFEDTLTVWLSQAEDSPIYYALDSGDDQAYYLPVVADRTLTVHAYAVELVDGVEYRSATSSFFYYRCAENELLQDGDCVAQAGPGERVLFSEDYRWDGGSASNWPDELSLTLAVDLLVDAQYTAGYPRSVVIADPVFTVDEGASSLRPTLLVEVLVPFTAFDAAGNSVSVTGSASIEPTATGGTFFRDGVYYEWALDEGPLVTDSCAAGSGQFHVSGERSATLLATVQALDDGCDIRLTRSVTPWDNSASNPWGGTRFDRRSAYPEIVVRFTPY